MADRIEKRIELKAPVSRVWRALTDYREFGEWFRVKLEGPFVEGQVSRGMITHPGYEHVLWEATVQRIAPEKVFSFIWGHIKSMDKETYSPDYSNAPTTLVEFRLEPTKREHCSLSPNRALTSCLTTPRRVVSQKRRRLDAADAEHREACRQIVVVLAASGGSIMHWCLPRWGMRRDLP